MSRHRARPASRRWNVSPVFVTGELLLTTGVLLGLMVVWQLFWTDIGASREQAGFVTALGEEWDEPLTVDALLQEVEDPANTVNVLSEEQMRTDDAPVPSRAAIAETFATIYVPRWGENYVKPISEGVSRARVLDPKGIGHYPDTELPGQVGNFAIAGHRTTYGKPFTDIQTLKTGDAIVIRTEGVWYVYEVTDSYIVKPNYIQAIRPDPYAPTAAPTKRYLTLTTCHPRYSAAERYIVHAELSYWAAVEDGVPPEIVGSATVQEAS